eukprot:COSAG05_NODE_7891_length_758_cov_1.559939_1_plen_56_part_10
MHNVKIAVLKPRSQLKVWINLNCNPVGVDTMASVTLIIPHLFLFRHSIAAMLAVLH